MAFETFLTHDKTKPKKGRRITYAVSLAVHAALLAIGVAGSYASVEELKPPAVPIVFLPIAPPPAPAGGGESRPTPRKPRPRPRVKAPPDKIVAPSPEPPSDSSPGSADTGRGPGDGPDEGPGPGGGGGGDGQAKFVPPNVARGQLAIDPQSDQHRARLPPALARAGIAVAVLMKICVDRDGRVNEVRVLKSDDPSVEPSFVSAVRTWRYTPYRVDGRPVPFCTTVRYEIRASH
jgi:TonB family protein